MKHLLPYQEFILEIRDHDSSEYDPIHNKELNQTGYWGSAGAGVLFVSRSTGRFLLAHRGRSVEQPGTYGIWGGAIDPGEDPKSAASGEALEETGYEIDEKDLIELYVFQERNFKYYNFLGVVDDEFVPELNWETQGYKWVEFGEWPEPLHFGLKKLFQNQNALEIMKSYNTQEPD